MGKSDLEIPIMFCFDNNYTIPASVAFYSLLDNANKNYSYKFFVMHTDITPENQLKLLNTIKPFKEFVTLEFINMDHKFQDIWNSINIKGHFSKEVMYKILAASIFPQYEKIIATDVDVVFLNDLSESYLCFDVNEDFYLAGTKMVGKMNYYMDNYKKDFSQKEIETLSSFCGGYIVFNLKKIREEDMEKRFIECFKKEGYRINQMEQDVLNLCCYPKIKKLPLRYVACSYMWDIYKNVSDMSTDIYYSKEEISEALNEPIQLHYATSTKPWNNLSCTKSEEWFKYLVKTPFLTEFLAKIQLNIEELENEILQKNVSNEDISEIIPKKNSRLIKIIKRILKYIYKNPLFVLSPKFYRKLINYIYKRKEGEPNNPSLLIVDDIFPSKLSPFRYEEYLAYLAIFDNTLIIANGSSSEKFEKEPFDKVMENFLKSYPQYSNKVVKYEEDTLEKILNNYANDYTNKIATFTFINNVCMENFKILKFLEKYDIPFVFTLYPGGGFLLDDDMCNRKLARVFSSPCFKKVIVTQKITYDYLINNNFCEKKDIKFIYGIVTPKTFLSGATLKKTKNIDICFVAHKYYDKGIDKGYDLFINSAKLLLKKYSNIVFHVVGGFSREDIDVSELKGHIKFYGIQSTNWFKAFYKDKNIIISPNRAFILNNGAFDGFPTGCCTEAMANGMVAFCTDELDQNIRFIDKKDLVIIKPFVNDIVDKISYYCEHPRKLDKISKRCLKKIKKIYSFQNQVQPRIDVIKDTTREVYGHK